VNNEEGSIIPKNIVDGLPPHLPEELIQTLLSTTNVHIERIVSHGHCSPEGFWYDQDTHEWVLLISGAGRLRFEGEEAFAMAVGDFVNIPAHKRHRVGWTDPKQATIWLAIHYS
jgi:cupin 2 domain-containing protein